jgi:hypothetical protein
MSPNARRPYFLADIEPTVAVAEAARWERETPVPAPTQKATSHDLMQQARLMRSAYQRELILRFADMIGAWFFSSRSPNATAKVRSDRQR